MNADRPEASPQPNTPDPARSTGLTALTGEDFSLAEAVGGWRGLVETTAPGLVFVIVYVATNELRTTLIAALAVTVLAVLARLLRRSSVTYALSGVVGVGIGAIWAARSGQAQDYFAWGLITNAAMLTGVLLSLILRWPVVGILAGALGLGGEANGSDRAEAATRVPESAGDVSQAGPGDGGQEGAEAIGQEVPADGNAEGFAQLFRTQWRSDPSLVRRYSWATWLWAGAFALRLLVQVPFYLGGDVGWLGTARLVMGVPMWALVLWITWLLIRPRAAPAAGQPASPST